MIVVVSIRSCKVVYGIEHDFAHCRPTKHAFLLQFADWYSSIKKIKAKFNHFQLPDLSLKSAWTSGSSEGTDCDVGRTFAWCSTGKLFAPSDVNSSVIWEKVPDGSPSAARCLVLSVLDRAALTQADCVNDRKPFVCQVLGKTQ